MEGLGFRLREEAVLKTSTEDVVTNQVKSKAKSLDPEAVRFSIARRLGLDIGGLDTL